jgi:excisionase family DNA binding protein
MSSARLWKEAKSENRGIFMTGTINPFDLLIDQVRQAVREEIHKALATAPLPKGECEAEPDWMRAEDLAKKYKLPKTLFEEKGREGKIQRTKPGRHVLFNVADVERFIKSNAGGGSNGSH